MVYNARPRKVAFCVSRWSAESTLFAWTFAKSYFLKKQKGPEGVTLDAEDQLFIVHVSSPKATKRGANWDAGGALIHSLQAALEAYPHTVVELAGSNVPGTVLDWAEANGIDVMILGSRDAKVMKAAMTKLVPGDWGLGSVSSRMLQHTRVPLLIVRPDAALKLNKQRIQSIQPAAPPEQSAITGAAEREGRPPSFSRMSSIVRTLSPGRLATYESVADARRVGLAFETEAGGRSIMQWAAAMLLQPSDQVFVLQVATKPSSPEAVSATSGPKPDQRGAAPLSDQAVQSCAAEELPGFEVVLGTQMRGDPRERMCAFAEDESLDLLLVGRSIGSRFRKAFTPGGTVSQYVVNNAPCPVLVVPHKTHGALSPDELSPRERRTSTDSGAASAASASTVARPHYQPAIAAMQSFSEPTAAPQPEQHVAQLQQELAAKDAEIAALKEQVKQLQLSQQPQPRHAAAVGSSKVAVADDIL